VQNEYSVSVRHQKGGCQKINASFAILYFYHKMSLNGILFAGFRKTASLARLHGIRFHASSGAFRFYKPRVDCNCTQTLLFFQQNQRKTRQKQEKVAAEAGNKHGRNRRKSQQKQKTNAAEA
jgi:hypothetical protein